MIPKAAKDDAIIGSWGKSLESFERKDGVSSVDKDDMQRILDVKGAKGGGWLTNAAVDAYLSTLMPSVAEAEPGARRVFLPGAHSHTLENTGTLGFSSENWSVNKSGDYVMKKDVAATVCNRARTSCVLLGADELYVNYNVKNFHWGLMRVLLKYQRCEIYDSTAHTKKEHGRNLLRGIQELTGVDTSAWSIVVYETHTSGMAQPTLHTVHWALATSLAVPSSNRSLGTGVTAARLSPAFHRSLGVSSVLYRTPR